MVHKRGADAEVLLQADPAVVRVGDTVHRPSTKAAVHALLVYLEEVDFPYSPRLLGLDEDGREVLSYLPGSSGRQGWAQVVPGAGLRAFAQLLCAYHTAVADFAPTVHEWELKTCPPLGGEIICHGDFGPWNVIWDGGRPVGLLDFDFAGPAPPLTRRRLRAGVQRPVLRRRAVPSLVGLPVAAGPTRAAGSVRGGVRAL